MQSPVYLFFLGKVVFFRKGGGIATPEDPGLNGLSGSFSIRFQAHIWEGSSIGRIHG